MERWGRSFENHTSTSAPSSAEVAGESRRRSTFPLWYCPVWACSFRTKYARNVGRHLKLVHGFDDDTVKRELSLFFEVMSEGSPKGVILCDKAEDDPCRPRGVG